jgi:hypothetical protein
VIGIDNVSHYYDLALKEARLAKLKAPRGFTFHRLDLADRAATSSKAVEHLENDGGRLSQSRRISSGSVILLRTGIPDADLSRHSGGTAKVPHSSHIRTTG